MIDVGTLPVTTRSRSGAEGAIEGDDSIVSPLPELELPRPQSRALGVIIGSLESAGSVGRALISAVEVREGVQR
jgi:hypothetical protein